MAATAGTFVFVGKSGQTYSVDTYIPDATGSLLTFSPSGLSTTTSPVYWKAPEPCSLVDVSIGTAPTAVGCILTLTGASYIGKTLRWANQLQTLANRIKLNIPIPAGEQVGAMEF